MGISGITAVAEYKAYTAGDILDLLNYVAPKMMERGGAHFSYGIADNLDDPKYNHYRYWSNPLETRSDNEHSILPFRRVYVYLRFLVYP